MGKAPNFKELDCPRCDSCKYSVWRCGYLWCTEYRFEVMEFTICDTHPAFHTKLEEKNDTTRDTEGS